MDYQTFPEQGAKNPSRSASSQSHEQEPRSRSQPSQSQPSTYTSMGPRSTPQAGADSLTADLAGLYQNSSQLQARRPQVQLSDMRGLTASSKKGLRPQVKAKEFWEESRLRQCTRYFGDNIIQATASEPWVESTAFFHSLEFIDQNIIDALEMFTNELARKLPQMDELLRALPINARQRIRDFRRQLAEYIRTGWQKAYSTSEAQQRELVGDNKNTAPSEVIETLCAAGLKYTDSDNSRGKQERTGYSDSRTTSHFLFKSPGFSNFCSDLRKRLYDTASPILAHTKATVLGLLTPWDSDVPEADRFISPENLSFGLSIETDWKPVGFLASQYGNSPIAIGSVIAYTGFASYAFASTCSNYLGTTWASTSAFFLRGLEQLLNAKGPERVSLVKANVISDPLTLKMRLSHEGCLIIQVISTPDIIVQITQQCLWISSALRLAPEADQPRRLYSNGLISTKMPSPETETAFCLHISCQFEEILGGEESCWLELVDESAVLCRHFPIPSRNDEKGLEIPLQIACGLTGIKHAVEFDGGIVMKAPSAMLVPISRKNNIVQWHFIANLDENTRFTYQEGLSQCKRRATIKDVDFEALQITRAVVGWCKKARKVVGRQDANYAEIDYSTASLVSSSIKFSGGSIGVQQFAIAQADFILGPKDSKVPFQRRGNFGKILRLAKRQHLVLHDTGDKRAWLVNADDVILHVIQTSIAKNPHHGQMQLRYQDSAAETLRLYQNVSILDDSETVTDMVMGTWSTLEMLLDQVVQSNNSPGQSLTWHRKSVVGFEFMGVVEERSPFEKVKYNMEDTSGGWTRLIKDTSTLVLFARGLKDLITAEDSDASVCSAWRTMPKGKNYLGTTVPVLMDFYTTAGSGQKLQRLTRSGLCWCSEHLPFRSCPNSSSSLCCCNRLQDITDSGSNPSTAPNLEENGGVIFGKPSSYTKSLYTTNKPRSVKVETGKRQGKQVLYMQTNGPISSIESDDKPFSRIPKKQPEHVETRSQETVGQRDVMKSPDKGITCRDAGQSQPDTVQTGAI